MRLRPDGAVYNTAFREFLLPYDDVRLAESPDAMLLDFLQSSYEAAADRGGWNRSMLERSRSPVSVKK